jgi:hypothetical protein
MRTLRKVRRLGALAGLGMLGACGSYDAEMRDYGAVFARYGDGAVEVSLQGEWSEPRRDLAVKGSPYALLVRYVDAAGAREAELASIAVRGRTTGAAVPLPQQRPEPFVPIPGAGEFGFGPGDGDSLAVPPNRYAAFVFPGLRLQYQPYEVSGVLVLRGADGAPREGRFQGVLVPQPRTERRNRFWERFMSV